jgi:two-component sensor histidine kinase
MRQNGERIWIAWTNHIVQDAQGKVIEILSVGTDITERKRAEEQIRASLREKEVLLKEIHHRVKNDLQVISGLLTLQAAQIGDERLQRVLKESQSRIWTMALIHQTLYQTGNLADIDMADYIRSLTGNLLSSHAQVAMPPTVSFNLLPVRLAIDKAIPLALIVNELVTNALKHAFPDGQPGEIRISLQERRCTDPRTGAARRAPTNQDCAPTYELTIVDNGIGLPAGFDLKNQKSLGLQLVTMLARQLDGKLTIESKGGTSFAITFNHNEKN